MYISSKERANINNLQTKITLTNFHLENNLLSLYPIGAQINTVPIFSNSFVAFHLREGVVLLQCQTHTELAICCY